ncbi:MAG: NAD-dependent succinate-semialdehyde dehydrogenase [Anaerolineae bacterium]|nr:NAD-dependent succinate-semialdehyde dehydrogenase [Gemmatimonadaceae bacterium]
MPISSINPATGETLATYCELSAAALEQAVARASDAFREYREVPMAERARRMLRVADILEAERAEFGRMMTLEMGKPIAAARDEAVKCARACRYYAENAERMLEPEDVATDAKRSYVVYQPVGVVLAVMPWNFPFWQVFRFAAPALMAGNVALLKHASNVPQCALAIEQIFRRAGFEDGVFTSLLVGAEAVGRLLEDARVVAATLTGSEGAGRSVASIAGKNLKKTVLELGGSDPFIVMPSADLDTAILTAVKARTINSGQSCIAAKRFIIHEGIAGDFERGFVAGMAKLTVGDPLLESTAVGPLATPRILAELDEQVLKSVEAGARVLVGGARLEGAGNFYQPTVLTDIPRNSPAFAEELFGPVASLFRVASAAEAIALANDTSFGLASSVWTNDANERDRFIEEIQAGQVFINAMVASDPRLPFGGVKRSGYGRELAAFGLREFVNVKTVWIGS